MSKRYLGGYISATLSTPNASMANGVYSLVNATQYKNSQLWPGSADLTITPAVNGKTVWTFAIDGNLSLTTPGEYQIIPNRPLTKVVKMWGGAGMPCSAGSTAWGQSGAGGSASGTVSFLNGSTYFIRVGAAGSTGTPAANAYGAGSGGGIYSTGAAGSGGGYSAIFMGGTAQQNAILMAGGGGGGAGDRADGLGGRAGLAGGGTTGQAVVNLQAGPGTQSAGGAAAGSGTPTSGTPLQGGNGSSGGGGGGGGYYGGGGGGSHSDGGYGGGGGSGYYNSTYVTSATLFTGSGINPGANTDPDRYSTAGAGSLALTTSSAGYIVIKA